MSKTIEDVVKELKVDIANKQITLRELQKLIGVNIDINKSVTPILNTVTESYGSDIFPVRADKDAKIMFLFKNKVTKGSKLSFFNRLYSDYNGKSEVLTNVIRRLKEEGKLAAVKYNNQNKRTFWGLSEWIDFETEDFKPEFKPDKSELPSKIDSTEILGGNMDELLK